MTLAELNTHIIHSSYCLFAACYPRFQVFKQDLAVQFVAVAWKRSDEAGGCGAIKLIFYTLNFEVEV